MIIVNQYESIIVNFDNISTIYLNGSGDKVVTALTSHSDKITLGEYATEERAKTVLQEIIELYRKDTFYKETQIDSGVYSRKEINHPLPKVYEMPEV